MATETETRVVGIRRDVVFRIYVEAAKALIGKR